MLRRVMHLGVLVILVVYVVRLSEPQGPVGDLSMNFEVFSNSVPDILPELEDTPAAVFSTELPMYYINLDRSLRRKRVTQMSFGGAGRLIRVPAVDGIDLSVIHGAEGYLRAVRCSAGELALFYSHLKAMRQAVFDNAEIAIIMEDDLSPSITGRLTATPDEIVEYLRKEGISWDVVRLQYGFCLHTLTDKEFVTELVDGNNGEVLHKFSQPRRTKDRSYLDRFRLYKSLPEVTFVPIPEFPTLPIPTEDPFIKIVGSVGLTVSALLGGLAVATGIGKMIK